jgi:D-threo-aldose 1-dehydrogenase
LLPLCLAKGIPVIAGGVFNSGILADPRPNTHYNYLPAPPELVARARHIKALCGRHGVDIKAAALQFPLRHPAITSVLTGCRSKDEVEENVRLFHAPIPEQLWKELDT